MTDRVRYNIGEYVIFLDSNNQLFTAKITHGGVEHTTSEVHYMLIDAFGNIILNVPESRILPPEVNYSEDSDSQDTFYPELYKLVISRDAIIADKNKSIDGLTTRVNELETKVNGYVKQLKGVFIKQDSLWNSLYE